MISRRVDEEVGIIYVSGSGNWSLADLEDHYEQLRGLIVEFRRRGRRVRVFSDISQAQRQEPEVEARATVELERTYLPGDRVAVLTRNEDDRGYVRSLVGDAEVALFCSRLAAEMWLLHDRLDIPFGNKGR